MARRGRGRADSGQFPLPNRIIASYCLTLHSDTSIVKIICEWQEDFVIVRDRPPLLELVSVKHQRDEQAGQGAVDLGE